MNESLERKYQQASVQNDFEELDLEWILATKITDALIADLRLNFEQSSFRSSVNSGDDEDNSSDEASNEERNGFGLEIEWTQFNHT